MSSNTTTPPPGTNLLSRSYPGYDFYISPTGIHNPSPVSHNPPPGSHNPPTAPMYVPTKPDDNKRHSGSSDSSSPSTSPSSSDSPPLAQPAGVLNGSLMIGGVASTVHPDAHLLLNGPNISPARAFIQEIHANAMRILDQDIVIPERVDPKKYKSKFTKQNKASAYDTLDYLYGVDTRPGAHTFPRLEPHKHADGVLDANELREAAIESGLFFDKYTLRFRRKQQATKGESFRKSEPRIPADQVPIEDFIKYGCVAKKREKKHACGFFEVFGFRASIMNRLKDKENPDLPSFTVMILKLAKKAKTEGMKHQETFYSIWDLPIPQKFKEFAATSVEHATEENMTACMDWLKKTELKIESDLISTKLKDVYTKDEKLKLKRKLQHRFPTSYKDQLWEKLLDMSFVDAQTTFINDVLQDCDDQIRTLIGKISKSEKRPGDNPYGLIPGTSVFSAKSPISIKLIYEANRSDEHIGTFYAQFLSAIERIQEQKKLHKTNGKTLREVAVTIVGPQDNEFSRKYFGAQMLFAGIARQRNPDVPYSLHGLEKSSLDNLPKELESIVPLLQPLIEGGIPGRLAHGSQIDYNKKWAMATFRDFAIAVEFLLSTAEITTGIAARKLPFLKYFHAAVKVILGTDDPGVLREKTTMVTELIKLILTYRLSYEDVRSLIFAVITSIYSTGESIISETVVPEEATINGAKKMISKRLYALKPKFSEIYAPNFDIGKLNGNEKGLIQYQYLIALKNFEDSVYANRAHAYKDGILKPPSPAVPIPSSSL